MIAFAKGDPIDMSWNDVLNYKPETRTAEDIEDHVIAALQRCDDNADTEES